MDECKTEEMFVLQSVLFKKKSDIGDLFTL